MYEIYFEPKGGIWRIRLTTYFFLLFSVSSVVSVAVPGEGKSVSYAPRDFDTFEDALAYSRTVGLDTAYRLCRRYGIAEWLNGEAAHAQGTSR